MMRRICAAVCAVAALAALPIHAHGVTLGEFDSTVSAFAEFTSLLELQQAHELDTNQHLTDDELAMLEVEENPSYTAPFPPVTYASYAAGGVLTPFSNVNPLAAPWAGFAPVAAPVGVAAVAASPLSAAYYGHPAVHAALGVNTALYPAAFGLADDTAKGGYNVHGLNAGNVFGGYHPGLNADLVSLSGKAGAGDAAAAAAPAAAAEAGAEAGAEEAAPAEEEAAVFVDVSADAELDAEAALDADIEAVAETEFIEMKQEPEEAAAEEAPAEEGAADAGAEAGAAEAAPAAGGEAAGANPSYTLPYPPVLPGHYTPLFNPYTNVNPLSTPFANYAATPGAHPGVAATAAAQAGGLAAINSQIAGANGAYPYYPYAGGAGVPFSGYAGWIHPQNLNQASVGENAEAASLGQFLEVTSTEETVHTGCVGCEY